MKRNRLCLIARIIVLALLPLTAFALEKVAQQNDAMHCVAFSPYVDALNPDFGPAPSAALIGSLLDKIVSETPFRCIMTYGVTGGLEQIFSEAQARAIKVIAIVWLDQHEDLNTQSIEAGIKVAKQYPETIVKISCGSEVRTRHGYEYDREIFRCLNALRAAGVTQPLTTIDTWWEWCDRSTQCRKNLFSEHVDWIGTNIFPWWENKHAEVYTCTPANKAADFHIARLSDVRKANPGKEVVLTEFGWPNGPNGARETNYRTRQRCGIANRASQALVVRSTLQKLLQKNWSGVVFQAFSEDWKAWHEGPFGGYWGICDGKAPYTCSKIEWPKRLEAGKKDS